MDYAIECLYYICERMTFIAHNHTVFIFLFGFLNFLCLMGLLITVIEKKFKSIINIYFSSSVFTTGIETSFLQMYHYIHCLKDIRVL